MRAVSNFTKCIRPEHNKSWHTTPLANAQSSPLHEVPLHEVPLADTRTRLKHNPQELAHANAATTCYGWRTRQGHVQGDACALTALDAPPLLDWLLEMLVLRLLELLLATGLRAAAPPSSTGSGEKYTSLMSEPPMSRAMWLTYSASWLGSTMLGAALPMRPSPGWLSRMLAPVKSSAELRALREALCGGRWSGVSAPPMSSSPSNEAGSECTLSPSVVVPLLPRCRDCMACCAQYQLLYLQYLMQSDTQHDPMDVQAPETAQERTAKIVATLS